MVQDSKRKGGESKPSGHAKATEHGIPKPSADPFLRSPANDQAQNAVGIMRSGTGEGIAQGVRTIEARGGLIFAQDSARAKHAPILEGSVAARCVESVPGPQQITAKLARPANLSPSGDSVALKRPKAPVDHDILELVRQRTGALFVNCKKTTIQRRRKRLTRVAHTGLLEHYERILQADPIEFHRRHQGILVSVTSLFHDLDAFGALAAAVADIIVGRKKPEEGIQAWEGACCATRMAAYFIALQFADEAACPLHADELQVLAHDIGGKALAETLKGTYRGNHISLVAKLNPHLISKPFSWTGNRYQVNKWLHDRISFAHHDGAKAPRFSRMDLMCCQNALIYTEPRGKGPVLEAWPGGLRPPGSSVPGKAESTQHHRRFTPVDASQEIFRREEACLGSALPPMERVVSLNMLPASPQTARPTPPLEACAQIVVNPSQTPNDVQRWTNEKLQICLLELAAANANLEDIKDNLPYPLIMTDEQLRVMVFNPAATLVVGLSSHDVGQVITTLAVGIDIPNFHTHLLSVIRENREVELQLKGQRDYLMRIRPYRAAQGETKGTVIAFWDNTELRRAQQQLKEKAAQIELQVSALEAARHGIVITDATQPELPIVYVNPAFQELTGYSAQEALGRNCRFLQGPDTDMAARKIIRQSHAKGEPARVVLESYRKDGTRFWNDLSIAPVQDNDGTVSHFIYVEDDITDRCRSEERTRLAVNVFESAREGILITDASGKVLSANSAFTAMTGYEHDEVLGRNPSFMQSRRHGPSFYREMWKKLKAKGEWHGEIWDRRKDGAVVPLLMSISAVPDSAGTATHFVAFYTDIMRLKEAERRLELLAYYDPLTGLPNRTLIYERLHQAISRAEREHTRVAVMFLDLDRFKVINDTLGHEMGDQLLCQVASRIKDCFRQVDTVARVGGDEFIVLLEKVEHAQQIHHIVRRVLEALAAPYQLRGRREVYSGASIGIAFFPEDGTDVDTLLRNADTAMYRSKSEARNGYRFYAAAMNALHLERLQLENDLRRALKRQEFEVHYQPKVALDTGQTLGLEALIRWNHPEKGMLAPREFIGLAEETGLILDVERWVLRQVTAQHRAWQGSRLGTLSISVNLSAPHLEPNAGLIPTLRGLLDTSGSSARWLELELLESSMMPSNSEIPNALWSVRELGVRVAIDDFGTGYSNLAYIKHLPIDILKIDQSFVRDIANDPNDAAIVEAVTALTRSLKITAVAEGIETERQVAFLRGHRCPAGQGYHFSRPLRADDLSLWEEARCGLHSPSPH
jgi:diguanylate cyclase (GGDEF)-like protein/PAS domain S-box-containing protein